MSIVLCVVPVCPMRSAAAHASEQISQLIFGETATVQEEGKDFVRVQATTDQYEGWVQRSQVIEVPGELIHQPIALTTDWVSEVMCNENKMLVPLGSNVGWIQDAGSQANLTFSFSGEALSLTDQLCSLDNLKHWSMLFMNTSYQWGGRTVFGVDCSGFTQMVFRFCGKELMRDAYQQATQGELIGFLQEVQLGDLAFFDNEEGRITHVGILLNDHTIIHASGKVRIDKMDQAGIVNSETGKRTHKLRIIKRMRDL